MSDHTGSTLGVRGLHAIVAFITSAALLLTTFVATAQATPLVTLGPEAGFVSPGWLIPMHFEPEVDPHPFLLYAIDSCGNADSSGTPLALSEVDNPDRCFGLNIFPSLVDDGNTFEGLGVTVPGEGRDLDLTYRWTEPIGALEATCTDGGNFDCGIRVHTFFANAYQDTLEIPVTAGALPTIIADVAEVTEGDEGVTTVGIPVVLSEPSPLAVSATWATFEADASMPGDADPASGLVQWPPGETEAFVTIDIHGDTTDEFDEIAPFVVGLPTNATIGGFYGIGGVTILDDDEPPVLTPGTVVVNEGDSGPQPATVEFELSSPSGKTVTADWTTVDWTATGGSDFTPAAGALTFAPGEVTRSVTVDILGDTDSEPDEIAAVRATNLVNASPGGVFGHGFLGIVNDDAGSDCSPLQLGPGAHLAFCDLTGVDLSGADLTGADLRGAILTDTLLTDTNLTGAQLGEGIRSGGIAGRPSALPPGWRLASGYLAGPEADLTDAVISGADLRDLAFTDSVLRGAVIVGTDLGGGTFEGADLTGAVLVGSDLSTASFVGADLTGVTMLDVAAAATVLDGVPLAGATISSSSFLGASLLGADLTDATIIASTFVASDLTGASLTRADLTNSYLGYNGLVDVDLRDADMTGTNLTFSDVTGFDPRGANWTGATCADGSSADTRGGTCWRLGVDVFPQFGSTIDLYRHYRAFVVIYGVEEFSRFDVDGSSLTFGRNGDEDVLFNWRPTTDRNGDGLADLAAFVYLEGSGLAVGDTEACLQMALVSGDRIYGCDAVTVTDSTPPPISPPVSPPISPPVSPPISGPISALMAGVRAQLVPFLTGPLGLALTSAALGAVFLLAAGRTAESLEIEERREEEQTRS